MELNLKTTLKTLKINEPTISAILGAIVLVAIALLLVNYFKARTNTISTTLPAVQTQNSEKAVALPTKHTVAKGEHLWKIAENYYKSGYNWVDIAKANNLKNPNFLVEGQELTIPAVEVKQAVVTSEQQMAQAPPGKITNTAAQTEAISGNSYIVEKGDNLWEISVRAYSDGYQWPKLAKENKITNPNKIYPGQEIKLSR